ncbi:ubiquitinyl hydrolase [Jaminaea rosea]|uniref:Ubiquitin carboxyl-terminal hydrolase n=1 Tax=Jaminaea rosea TaxID=1569628 RepID=A0A316UTF9_9BASI|nr:ubiquitinyl hydrolase [Jaminaea rosea]PWN28569.1 ubiquitinyl hydrolase [Jaminaea rosea]
MACSHLSAAFTSLNPPRPSQQVHRDECTLCFDDQDGELGVDVCLTCFNGACPREHSRLHFQKTGHSLVANVKRRRKAKPPVTEEDKKQQPQKLAIAAESEEDMYEWETTPKCLACDADGLGKVLPRTDKLDQVISAMMRSLSSSQQNEVKAWEEEIVPCSHTRELQQQGQPFKLEASGLAKCAKCDLTSNLWLCLTCGNLGCGRAQFGGVGGNSHGLSHFEESGHPVSVKQGTITAEGTADIYCYACNDARIDPNLADHLHHFGINVMSLSKTEKSMTELQLEQNMKFDFTMTGEDGKELEPLYGPGLTGLRNLGNSCYMASILQSLFAFPAFKTRYGDAYRPHTAACENPLPATCLECQTGKLADGLLSGRYAVPRALDETEEKEGVEGPRFQAGIRPSMFKALIGKGHEEFSTMRQQDADEFLKHIVSALQRESKRLSSGGAGATSSAAAAAANNGANHSAGAPTGDPTSIFSFGLQQRLQCTECKRVRYTVEAQDAGLSLPVPLRRKQTTSDAVSFSSKAKQPVEGVHAVPSTTSSSAAALDDGPVEYEPVPLSECLDIFTAPETLSDYHCPQCDRKTAAVKQTLFTSFPDVLAVQVRRFQLVNWVPQKVDVPVLVPLEEDFDLDRYLGKGRQAGEEEMPDTRAEQSGGGAAAGLPEFDAAAMSQLTSMGFHEVRAQKALLATGNTGDAEAAMNWLFAHMEDTDIDDPIQPAGAAAPAGAASGAPDTSMLEEMGFSSAQARKALRVNGGNAEMAVAWLFENPDDPGEEEGAAVAANDNAGESSSGANGSGPSVVGGSSQLPATYRLKSFVSHKGPSVHSGHYVAHIRTPESLFRPKGVNAEGQVKQEGEEEKEAWVFFNDEKVVKAPLSAMKEEKEGESGEGAGEKKDVGVKGLVQLAYVYFFERQGGAPAEDVTMS